MVWSFSAGRTFERCVRQWFFRQVVAHHAAKDPLRREAYLLSKLDNLWSWRGRLVDDVISRAVVPALALGKTPELSALLPLARAAYDAQLAFAAGHRLGDADLKPSRHPDFLLLRDFEQGTPPADADLAVAWHDVETALTQLLAMTPLLERLLSAAVLLPQQALTYKLELPDGEPVTVRAVPDLLAFFADAPPLIIDWKVHRHAAHSYREQLAGYAFALSRARTQRGLPTSSGTRAAATDLLEVQLLSAERRHYALNDADVAAIRSSQTDSAQNMHAFLAQRGPADRNPYTVPTTADLGVCSSCVFQARCWRGSTGPSYDSATPALF